MTAISFTILSLVFLLQIISRKTPAVRGFFGRILFFTAILSVFSFAFYESWLQYTNWSSNEFGKLFLPPYQDLDYFIFYVRSRFFNQYILSLLFALVFLNLTIFLNKKNENKFFEEVEPYLFATGLFLSGHPGWLFYLAIVLFLSLLSASFHFWNYGHEARLSLYYFWLPSALFIIIISKWLNTLPWWQLLKV